MLPYNPPPAPNQEHLMYSQQDNQAPSLDNAYFDQQTAAPPPITQFPEHERLHAAQSGVDYYDQHTIDNGYQYQHTNRQFFEIPFPCGHNGYPSSNQPSISGSQTDQMNNHQFWNVNQQNNVSLDYFRCSLRPPAANGQMSNEPLLNARQVYQPNIHRPLQNCSYGYNEYCPSNQPHSSSAPLEQLGQMRSQHSWNLESHENQQYPSSSQQSGPPDPYFSSHSDLSNTHARGGYHPMYHHDHFPPTDFHPENQHGQTRQSLINNEITSPVDMNRKNQCYTAETLALLRDQFNRKAFLDGKERKVLAEKTGLTDKQVQIWFANRRRDRREHIFSMRASQNRNEATGPENRLSGSSDNIHSSVETGTILQRHFDKEQNPSSVEYQLMSLETGLKVKQVKDWFIRRRNAKQNNADRSKEKERRQYFSPEMLKVLEKKFKDNNSPDPFTIQAISDMLGIRYKKVLTWFGNKRRRSTK